MVFEGDYFQSTTFASLEEYKGGILESTAGAPSSEILAELRRLILDQQSILYNIFYELRRMNMTLLKIEGEIRNFKGEYTSTEDEHVIVVREIPYEEVKRMVEEYLADKEGEILDALEIADVLRLPFEDVHRAVLELIEEGKVEIAEEKEE